MRTIGGRGLMLLVGIFLVGCASPGDGAAMGGGGALDAKDDRPHVLLVIGDDYEYGIAESMRWLAGELKARHAMRCTVVEHVDHRFDIPGMEAIAEADLAIFFIRRRMLHRDSMRLVREYLDAGKPLIAFRTSSHAFDHRDDNAPPTSVAWRTFDRDVLGCHYAGYTYGYTQGVITEAGRSHPIMQGVEGDLLEMETMYRSAPLATSCEVLMMGTIVDGDQDNPRYRKPEGDTPDQPIAWINTLPSGARVFYTSMGDSKTFKQPWFQKMVLNAVHFMLER